MAASLWQAVMGSTPKEDLYSGIEFWSDPERTGWLTKQGEYIKTWRRRWFVLKQGKLFWFKESIINRGSKPRGVIPVNTCLTVKGAEDVLNKQFAFELSTNSETMYFIADSEKEKEDWINSIGRSIVQHSRSVTDSEVVDYDNRRFFEVMLIFGESPLPVFTFDQILPRIKKIQNGSCQKQVMNNRRVVDEYLCSYMHPTVCTIGSVYGVRLQRFCKPLTFL